jgi:hypothetical protein
MKLPVFQGLSRCAVVLTGRRIVRAERASLAPAGPDHNAPFSRKGHAMATADSTPVYRDVVGFPGYRVGDDGSVWTCKVKGGNDRTPGRVGPWRLLSVQRNRRGYCFVNLDLNGRNYPRFIHRLVLEAFVGARPDGKEACHYPDFDKSNNRLENLRWDTRGENAKDEYRDRGPVTEKRCRRCGEVKPAADFYPDKRASDRLGCYCKGCHNRASVASRDQEKRRAYNREWMRAYKSRRKEAPGA